MENQTFEIFEQKIDQILSMLARMRSENQELRLKNQEMQNLLNEKDRTIQTLTEETERYHNMRSEINTYKEKQDSIRSKVETLLQKLKEFDDIQ